MIGYADIQIQNIQISIDQTTPLSVELNIEAIEGQEIIVKDEWTQENGIVGPTQKLKRGAIEDIYSKDYLKWHNSPDQVLFE